MKFLALITLCLAAAVSVHAAARPNMVLVMTDDQGWGQTGYFHHPALTTPNLDAWKTRSEDKNALKGK